MSEGEGTGKDFIAWYMYGRYVASSWMLVRDLVDGVVGGEVGGLVDY